ncbi:MAG: cell division protein FtsA [Candidatus Zixiibacteriota bacterium]
MSATAATVTGLDIGSSQVTAVIAEWDDGEFKIIGVGRAPSTGLRRGVIVHLDRTEAAVRKALDEAELMAGAPHETIHVNISGDHIRSLNSRGVVAVSRGGGPISDTDVDRVLRAARAVSVPPDRDVIHVLPSEFVVDEQGGIRDPIGMIGSRLEVEVHIITAATLAVSNIHHCIENIGFRPASITLSTLAAADAVLSERDREMGVAVIDVGAGLTDIAVYFDDAIRHTAAIAIGGRNITNDLAIGLRTPIEAAEAIKLRDGAALSDMVADRGPVEVPGVGEQAARLVSPRVVASIIEPRLEEIFMMAKREIDKAPVTEMLAAGAVLTGGGAAIPGATELAERILDLPVRMGRPANALGMMDRVMGPADAVALGLIARAEVNAPQRRHSEGFFHRLSSRIGEVLSEFL